MVVGDWFGAQHAFNNNNFACSAGQSIAEYCAKAQDTCCAVCPNAPITGPGTAIVSSLGTFVNLLFVLWYASEAPYNLAYQILATDGAFFGILNRLIQPEYRLSQFHYAFVPLAIMSCIPLALAACLNDYASYHSHTPNAIAALQHAKLEKKKSEALTFGGLDGASDSEPLRRSSTAGNASTTLHSLSRMNSRASSHAGSTRSLVPLTKAKSRPQEAADLIDELDIPRKYLIHTAWGFFIVHILLWPCLFSFIYFKNFLFNQPQCADEYPLKRDSMILAGLAFSWWVFGAFVCISFSLVIFGENKPRRDLLEQIGLVFHLTQAQDDGHHVLRPAFNSRSGVKRHLFPKVLHDKHSFFRSKARARSITRWSISIGVFAIWVTEYLVMYFRAVQSYVLIGTNGFDYGQVAAVCGIGIPAFLIVRAQLDYNIYWTEARKLWSAEDPEKERQEREQRRIEKETLGSDHQVYQGLLPHLPTREQPVSTIDGVGRKNPKEEGGIHSRRSSSVARSRAGPIERSTSRWRR
ncbi:uncharacterized protein JCM6883_004275 [Sporobolomyces salmoneus]|uniref:uncharacterized protein n=1 Tax=Sporobolomyces salmoneus TaxID=183962 RepID=UPI00317A3A7D